MQSKQWRPSNWENPFHKTADFGYGKESWNENPEFGAYEAGADAMLEALKKKDNDYRPIGWYDDIGYIDEAGWLVFIEDKKGS